MVHQKIDAMVFFSERIFLGGVLNGAQSGHRQFKPRGRPLVGAHRPRDFERRFEPERLGSFKNLLGHILLGHHSLNEPRAVPQL